MGQREILRWLAAMREMGDGGYFTAREIMRGVGSVGGGSLSVRMNLNQLYKFGIIERRAVSMMQWKYRIRDKYVDLSLKGEV